MKPCCTVMPVGLVVIQVQVVVAQFLAQALLFEALFSKTAFLYQALFFGRHRNKVFQ